MAVKVLKREIVSDPVLLPELEEYVINAAVANNVNEDKINNLALAFSEAASNAVLHGNNNNPSKKVFIVITIDDDFFKVSIKDEGNGFKLDQVPDPTKPENILKESGRGIHIMKSFLDDLQYKFSETGTEVILVLRK